MFMFMVTGQFFSTYKQLFEKIPNHSLFAHEYIQGLSLANVVKKKLQAQNLPVVALSVYAVDATRYYLYPSSRAMILSESEFENFENIISRSSILTQSKKFLLVSNKFFLEKIKFWQSACHYFSNDHEMKVEYVVVQCSTFF